MPAGTEESWTLPEWTLMAEAVSPLPEITVGLTMVKTYHTAAC